MMSILKRLSIRGQLIILIVCTVIIMLTVILLMYFNVSKAIEEDNRTYTNGIFMQINRNISNNFDMFSNMLRSIAYNTDVQKFIYEANQSMDPIDYYNAYRKVDELFISVKGIKSGIVDLIVLGDNGNLCSVTDLEEPIMEELLKLPDGAIDYCTKKREIISSNDGKRDCFIIASVVYFMDGIKNIDRNRKIGVVAIVVDARMFGLYDNKIYSEDETKFYLIDRENNAHSFLKEPISDETNTMLGLIASSNSGHISTKVDNEKYVVNYKDIPEMGGKIVSIIPEEKLFEDIYRIRSLAFTVLVVALIMLSIPFTIIINNIVQPLNKFMDFINRIKSGNLKELKERVFLKGYQEMEIMSSEFNSMLDEIDALTHRLLSTSTRLYEAELEKKQAELMYLKSQINPHFLYNTLESIIGTAFQEGARSTVDMVKALVTIFRYSVKGEDIVLLSEELRIVKAYIYIQQIRFSDMFEVIYQFDANILNCAIPKIILQPVVENAIFHGLETKLERGHLWIGGKMDEYGSLCIWVNDDGKGIDSERLEYINKQIEGEYGKNSGQYNNASIGIINVNNRIKLMYGNEYGVTIDSRPDRGTRVSIRIPAGRNENV